MLGGTEFGERDKLSNFSIVSETIHIGKQNPNQPKCHMKLGHTFLTWFPQLLSPRVRVCGVSSPIPYQMTKKEITGGREYKSQSSKCV